MSIHRLEENARLAADLADKLVRDEELPQIPHKLITFFDKHVRLD